MSKKSDKILSGIGSIISSTAIIFSGAVVAAAEASKREQEMKDLLKQREAIDNRLSDLVNDTKKSSKEDNDICDTLVAKINIDRSVSGILLVSERKLTADMIMYHISKWGEEGMKILPRKYLYKLSAEQKAMILTKIYK